MTGIKHLRLVIDCHLNRARGTSCKQAVNPDLGKQIAKEIHICFSCGESGHYVPSDDISASLGITSTKNSLVRCVRIS